MAGDASAWVESLKEYLEPAAKMAVGVKEQIESYDVPPAVAEAYHTVATAAGVEGVSPVYVGAGAIVASGVLLLTWGRCAGSKPTKTASGRGSKKKAKSKSTSSAANGSAHKNGGIGKGGGVPPAAAGGAAAANGGVETRGLPGKEAAPAVVKAKPAKKAAAKAPQPKAKGKGKAVPEAPPVITEEPEAAKKRVRKKKTAKEVKVAAAAAAAAPKKAAKKGSKANGSAAGGSGGGSRSGQNGTDAGGADPWGGQAGEWPEGGQGGGQGGEWETVSHKKNRPRKERPSDDADTIPGGGGL